MNYQAPQPLTPMRSYTPPEWGEHQTPVLLWRGDTRNYYDNVVAGDLFELRFVGAAMEVRALRLDDGYPSRWVRTTESSIRDAMVSAVTSHRPHRPTLLQRIRAIWSAP